MPQGSRWMLRATIVVSLLSAAAFVAPSNPVGAGEAAPLLPDLKTRRPNHLVLERDAGRLPDLLRFSNEIINRGRGPMEMRPEADCPSDPSPDARRAFQRVFQDANDNGVFDRGIDTMVEVDAGCTHYHPEHRHWHFGDFALYELIRIRPDGRLGRIVVSSEKVGFCLVDTNHLKPHLPSSPATKHYTGQCREDEETGISIGWSDFYAYNLFHQWVDIDGVRNGTYCLRSTADPSDRIAETRDGNNANSIKIELHTNRVDYRPRRPCV